MKLCRALVLGQLTNHTKNLRLAITNNSTTIHPINSLSQLATDHLHQKPRPGYGKRNTYNRLNKAIAISLKSLNSILGILRITNEFGNGVCLLISQTACSGSRRDVIQDRTELVCCWVIGCDFQFELAALLLCVGGVIACLIFCC